MSDIHEARIEASREWRRRAEAAEARVAELEAAIRECRWNSADGVGPDVIVPGEDWLRIQAAAKGNEVQ
jgi:hypothetical protein